MKNIFKSFGKHEAKINKVIIKLKKYVEIDVDSDTDPDKNVKEMLKILP